MSFNVRLFPAFAPVFILAALLAGPRPAEAQNQQQVHPITGLPLPPDEDTSTPAVTPAPKHAPAVAPAPKTVPTPRPSKKSATKPVAKPTLPPTEPTVAVPTPIVVPAPVAPASAEPKPEAVAPAPKPSTRKGRTPKPAPVVESAPEPVNNTVHAIKLPPPPDEEPASPAAVTPAPVTPAPAAKPAPVEPTPTTKPIRKTAPPPKPAAVKPAPVTEPVVVPEKPAVPKPETPKAPAPKPAEVVAPPPASHIDVPKPADNTPAPTKRLPVAPVEVPTVTPPSSNVSKPKTIVVPSSVVPVEPSSAPAPVVAPPKPAKPLPTLKSRNPNGPTTVTLPSSTVVTSPRSAVPSAAPKPAPAVVAPAPPPPPPGTLGRILFQGAAPFTDAELAPLTGLTLGAKPTSEDLQTASTRLIETGLFYNVKASYDTPNDVGTATFVLDPLPASQLARVSFANIVWLTPAEIDAAVKELPLYRGVLPMSGSLRMADSIQAALQGALASHGVQATLTHTLIPPSPQHPYPAMEFRVTSPTVILASASLFDIPPALVNRTLKAQTDAVKVPYNEGIAGTTLSDLLLAPARNAGYIGAKLWHIERKRHVVNRSTTSVDFVARMDAGPVYSVHSLNWTPTPVLNETDFRRQAALHVGQVPTAAAADKTQQAITDAYYAQGYLEANISASQTLDAKTGAADYSYTAVAGPQYHLGTISVQGLSPEAKQDFDAVWTMKPGDVYNEGYLLNFLNAHQNIASLKGYTFTYDRSTAPDTHLVALTLTFRK